MLAPAFVDLISIVPLFALAILIVPVVKPVNKLTVPVVTSEEIVFVPLEVPPIFKAPFM